MPDYTKFDGAWFVFYRQSTGEYKRLAKRDAPRWEQLKAYADFTEGGSVKFRDCINAYLSSNKFKSLAKGTQNKYLVAVATKGDPEKGISGNQELMYSFGDMEPSGIRPPDIRLFMDSWEHMPSKANNMHTALSAIIKWNIQRGYIVGTNPCQGVEKYPDKGSGRYVTDKEYKAFFDFLVENKKEMHAYAMAIAYLCGSRLQDVLRLTRHRAFNWKDDDCYKTEKGLIIYQMKTGKVQLKKWSDELKSIVDMALSSHSDFYIITKQGGGQYTPDGFKSTWQRMQIKAFEAGVLTQRFRFHDMKKKAASDVDADRRALFLGSTESTANRYNETADAVDPVR